jgi:hypothetical protein
LHKRKGWHRPFSCSVETISTSDDLQPAAAWYFIVIVYVFSPRRAKKHTQGFENDRQAKVLCVLFFALQGEK